MTPMTGPGPTHSLFQGFSIVPMRVDDCSGLETLFIHRFLSMPGILADAGTGQGEHGKGASWAGP